MEKDERGPAIFRARYRGRCNTCNKAVNPGELIRWSRRERGKVYHADCSTASGEAEQDDTPPSPAGGGDGQPIAGKAEASGDKPSGGQPSTGTDSMGGLAEAIAAAVKPHLDGELKAKSDQIEALREELARLAKSLQSKDSPPRRLVIELPVQDGKEPERIDNAHAMMPALLQLIAMRQHAYLWGPPGGGKSHAAQQAATALGLAYGYVALNPQTPESRLLGYMDANGNYHGTEFRRRYEEGGVFCIDEMDNAHPALCTTINGALENHVCAFPDGQVQRHVDFVLVATGNTAGRGGDLHFPERRAFDAAFGERFAFLHWGYDLALERELTLRINPHAEPWLDWVVAVREYAAKDFPRLLVTPRASMRGAALLAASDWDAAAVAESVLFKGLGQEHTQKILGNCPLPTVKRRAPATATNGACKDVEQTDNASATIEANEEAHGN